MSADPYPETLADVSGISGVGEWGEVVFRELDLEKMELAAHANGRTLRGAQVIFFTTLLAMNDVQRNQLIAEMITQAHSVH